MRRCSSQKDPSQRRCDIWSPTTQLMVSCLCLSGDNTVVDRTWKRMVDFFSWWFSIIDCDASRRQEWSGVRPASTPCAYSHHCTNPPRIDVNAPDFMVDLEWIETVWSADHCDDVWIHILALEDDRIERTDMIITLMIRFPECGWELVEGEMCLVRIEQQIFFHLLDVFLLVVGVSDESRQWCKGDNGIWIEWTGLAEMGKKLLHATGLVLQLNQLQTLRTIPKLFRHWKTWNRKFWSEIIMRKNIRCIERPGTHVYFGKDDALLWFNVILLRASQRRFISAKTSRSYPSRNHRKPVEIHLINIKQHSLLLTVYFFAFHHQFLTMHGSVPCHDPTRSNMSGSVYWHATTGALGCQILFITISSSVPCHATIRSSSIPTCIVRFHNIQVFVPSRGDIVSHMSRYNSHHVIVRSLACYSPLVNM